MVRVKTEEELLIEFGPRWYYNMEYGWNSNMKNLLGDIIPEEEYSDIDFLNEEDYYNDFGQWHPSYLTLVATTVEKEYKIVSNGLFKNLVQTQEVELPF